MAADRHSFYSPSSLYQAVEDLPRTMSSARLKSWSKYHKRQAPVFGKVASKSTKPWRNNNLGFLLVKTGHSCVSSKSVTPLLLLMQLGKSPCHYHVCNHSRGGSTTDLDGGGGWRQMVKTKLHLKDNSYFISVLFVRSLTINDKSKCCLPLLPHRVSLTLRISVSRVNF